MPNSRSGLPLEPLERGPRASRGHLPGEEDSVALLERARCGDRAALDTLFARYLPALRRWASGRLPRWARDIADTQDLVQDALLSTFKQVNGFEPEGEHALLAYLRQAVINRIRNEFRHRSAMPGRSALDSRHPDAAPSPLEHAITAERLDRYEAALGRLRPDDRDAVVSRMELGLSYEELARMLGKPTPNAARAAVVRALVRLTAEMNHG